VKNGRKYLGLKLSRNIYYHETERQVQIHMTTKQGPQNQTFGRNNDHYLLTQLSKSNIW